ncbi:carbohydrate ABC transporter permease [Microbacterium capsulatum]|uniref:Carbohydrate ABC transporter permease n=1 Tax=Microbacterium capsulatum TaxID=3041921 RepID=A0ABU0XHJ4_9MICO|nr:carbohydrate ABC transporter permease [Microbacterium sp. ASV81]MDQ4214357.1 carbohydrate ABC transporter permease [Microbacterium sp. ASV81]
MSETMAVSAARAPGRRPRRQAERAAEPRTVWGWGSITVLVLLAAHLVIVLFPFVWMIYSSFKTNREFQASVWSLPSALNWSNYAQALADGSLALYAVNSLVVTIVSVLITVTIATAAGYAFVVYRTRWMPAVEIVMLVAMAIPAYIALVPLVAIIRQMGLLDDYFGVILPTVAFNLPISVLIMRGFFASVPGDLIEAARIDGASEFSTFLRVMVPIAKPAMFTTAIVNVIWVWNDFLFPLVILNSPERKTLPLGLTDFVGDRTTNYPVLLAAILLAALGSFLVYLVFQRHVIGGLTSGALKQ